MGGIDTTSTVAEWTMVELMRNPRVMRKVQQEVRRMVGEKGKVDVNDITRMEYFNCVIKETLRLHIPTPLFLPRETAESVDIGGYHIPARTRVIINGWAIHRDPSSWDSPEEFIPERFENSTVDLKSQECFHYIPFGFGRRQCPGMIFGIAATEYLISNLLYWFDWKLPGSHDRSDALAEDLDMSEVFGIVLHKKVPLHVVPILHSP